MNLSCTMATQPDTTPPVERRDMPLPQDKPQPRQ